MMRMARRSQTKNNPGELSVTPGHNVMKECGAITFHASLLPFYFLLFPCFTYYYDTIKSSALLLDDLGRGNTYRANRASSSL